MFQFRSFIITISIIAFTCSAANAQKKMDTFTMNHFGKTLDIKASERKSNGDFNLYIQAHSIDKLVNEVLLIIKRDNLTTFRAIIDTAEAIYSKWSDAAKTNNITELNKDIVIDKIDIDASFIFEENRFFDTSVELKARFKIIDGKHLLIIENTEELVSETNKNIKSKGFYLLFNSTEELQSFSSKISQESIKRFHTTGTENHEIFKQ
ncbi:MAG: hypothetical protein IPO21_00930 [Bacteroidales bacterium]|nr:hypothetical protein [Bacteroidales bacterium]